MAFWVVGRDILVVVGVGLKDDDCGDVLLGLGLVEWWESCWVFQNEERGMKAGCDEYSKN